jgi:hypothetical protein
MRPLRSVCLILFLNTTFLLSQVATIPSVPTALQSARRLHGVFPRPRQGRFEPGGFSVAPPLERNSHSAKRLRAVASTSASPIFGPAATYGSGGGSPYSVTVADVNGDGKPDALVANDCFDTNCANGSVGVLLGNGDGTFQAPVAYSSGGQDAIAVAVGDVNGDGKPDVLVANHCFDTTCANGSVSVLLGNGDGTFQTPVSYGSGGLYALSVAVGDVNGDGKPDVLVANYCEDSSCATNGSVSVLLGNGDGTFQAARSYDSGGPGGQNAIAVAVGDVNGDGKPDLAVTNQCASSTNCDMDFGPGSVGVLLSNGDGTFQAPVVYSSGGQDAIAVAVADVNGDGKPDLLVSHWCVSSDTCDEGGVGVLLGNGDGTFQAPVVYSSGGLYALSVAAADVNGDGKPDLLVANESGNTVGVLLNIYTLPTTTMIASSSNPSAFGQSVTFTATVIPQGSGTATGTLTFSDNSMTLGTSPLNGGMATFATPALAVGLHSINAVYSGDSNFTGSTSNTLSQVVTKAKATTTLLSSMNPSVFGKTVSFTATVSSLAGTPTGKIEFLSGTTVLGTLTLTSGSAKYTTAKLRPGANSITAVYEGDSNNRVSTSAPLNQMVLAPTTTTLTSSPDSSAYGRVVVFTATVTPSIGAPPDGETVSFKNGATILGTGTLSGGTASFSTSTLVVGTKVITAIYGGDTSFAASKSELLSQVICKATSTATLVSSLTSSNYRQPVMFTATVAPEFSGMPTGKVAFYDGTTLLKTVPLTGGVAKFTTSTLNSGQHTITASYDGSTGFRGSSSDPLTQTVN